MSSDFIRHRDRTRNRSISHRCDEFSQPRQPPGQQKIHHRQSVITANLPMPGYRLQTVPCRSPLEIALPHLTPLSSQLCRTNWSITANHTVCVESQRIIQFPLDPHLEDYEIQEIKYPDVERCKPMTPYNLHGDHHQDMTFHTPYMLPSTRPH